MKTKGCFQDEKRRQELTKMFSRLKILIQGKIVYFTVAFLFYRGCYGK